MARIEKFFIAILLCLVAVMAQAQSQDSISCRETPYGSSYGRNLRYEEPTKVSNEASVGFIATGSSNGQSYGMQAAYRRVYANGLVYGLQAAATNCSGSSADAILGYKFGKNVTLEVDALAGYGQAQVCWSMTSVEGEEYLRYASRNDWGFEAGAQVRLGVPLTKALSVALIGGVKHNFVKGGVSEIPEHWSLDGQTIDANQWFAAVSLVYRMDAKAQYSGDNCWEAAVSGGISNQGTVYGAEILKYHRIGFYDGTIFGVGSEYVTKNGNTWNRLSGIAGYRITPAGARSWLVIDLKAKIGVGQDQVQANGSTEADEVQTWRNETAFCGFATANLGINLHFDRVQVGVNAFGGYDQAFKVDYSGDLKYSGETTRRGRAYYGAVARFSFAF
jgi:hypothetical protein